MLLTIQQTIRHYIPQTVVTSDCCQKPKSQGIWSRNRLHNVTKCTAMLAAAHKTGKLECYRIQQYSVCSNTISLNFLETAPPPLLFLLHLTIIFIIIISSSSSSSITTTTIKTTTTTSSPSSSLHDNNATNNTASSSWCKKEVLYGVRLS